MRELLSLIDFSRFDPALPAGHPFVNVIFQNGSSIVYWSSTIDAASTPFGSVPWTVNLSDGRTLAIGLNYFPGTVWPVRGGD